MDVRAERTGWRDAALSERHRRWGWDCPALDMDFIMLEYDEGKATAIVEYKNEHAAPQYPTRANYRALKDIGDRAGLPVFAVRYADDFTWFSVFPLNGKAREFVASKTSMSEVGWVSLLYSTRGREIPQDVRESLERCESW